MLEIDFVGASLLILLQSLPQSSRVFPLTSPGLPGPQPLPVKPVKYPKSFKVSG
jgi:hypothetical protein